MRLIFVRLTRSRLGLAPGFDSVAQQPFNLAIQAAQIFAGPAFEFAPELGINAQQYGFSRLHSQ